MKILQRVRNTAKNLIKGQRLPFTAVDPQMTRISVGLGWDINSNNGGDIFDLDSSLFLLGSDEKLISERHFIFYNNLISPDPNQSIIHMGDNTTGAGDGDDEIIQINLLQVPAEIQKMVVAVTIHEAEKRRQNFGQIQNAFVRIVNSQNNKEVIRYDLTDNYSTETSLIMAEIYRKNNEWRIHAVGSGYQGGLRSLLNRYQK